jgi:iron complex transport system ATP-binding protein
MEERTRAQIEARNVSVAYGDRPVVRNVSLAIVAGEMVGLIGPNGAGKSTLLRALSGALRTASGTVLLDGRDISALRPRDRALRLAFVPQSEAAVFEFPVKEVVLMGRHPHVRGLGGETSADFEAAARAMSACDILVLADRPVTALSGGEHRRVLIARALAQESPLLILDEPVAHLDVTHQVEILALARRMADRKSVAILAAVHELNLAAEFCDRLILLAGGAVIAEGVPEEVMTPELLERAYGSSIQVGRSPASGKPMIFPLHAPHDNVGQGRRVHVICGGATGAGLLSHLSRRGFCVTAGVLNELDTDQRAAEALGIPHVTEAPFSPISERAREECRALIDQADAVVMTEVPIGHGNLPNLGLALYARELDKPVLLLGSTPFSARDYTDENAGTDLWERLVDSGAEALPDSQAAVAWLTGCFTGSSHAC